MNQLEELENALATFKAVQAEFKQVVKLTTLTEEESKFSNHTASIAEWRGALTNYLTVLEHTSPDDMNVSIARNDGILLDILVASENEHSRKKAEEESSTQTFANISRFAGMNEFLEYLKTVPATMEEGEERIERAHVGQGLSQHFLAMEVRTKIQDQTPTTTIVGRDSVAGPTGRSAPAAFQLHASKHGDLHKTGIRFERLNTQNSLHDCVIMGLDNTVKFSKSESETHQAHSNLSDALASKNDNLVVQIPEDGNDTASYHFFKNTQSRGWLTEVIKQRGWEDVIVNNNDHTLLMHHDSHRMEGAQSNSIFEKRITIVKRAIGMLDQLIDGNGQSAEQQLADLLKKARPHRSATPAAFGQHDPSANTWIEPVPLQDIGEAIVSIEGMIRQLKGVAPQSSNSSSSTEKKSFTDLKEKEVLKKESNTHKRTASTVVFADLEDYDFEYLLNKHGMDKRGQNKPNNCVIEEISDRQIFSGKLERVYPEDAKYPEDIESVLFLKKSCSSVYAVMSVDLMGEELKQRIFENWGKRSQASQEIFRLKAINGLIVDAGPPTQKISR